MQRFEDGRDWFFEKRFGLFIHWGLYALNAWHEQDQFLRSIPKDEYTTQVSRFNPVAFDPDAWLDLAEEAGMQYVCFTAKHIDGFCMWDTAQTPYNVMNTPYRRDILAMLAEACHRRGFPLCLYYSIVDMNQPNYPNQGRSYERPGPEPGDEPDLGKYLVFLREQVWELCTRYGEISGFWWDGNVIQHCDPSANELIRSLQPNAVINDRGFDWATGFGGGDFGTPERDYNEGQVDKASAFTRPTEACQAVGAQSWGYREDEDYFTDRYLMENIAKVMAKGGNYLLNVGPKADGVFPDEATGILRRLGKWYRQVDEALVAEPASHLVENRDVVLTRRGNDLYVILNRPPTTDAVLLKPLNVMPRSAKLLNTGANVACSTDLIPVLHDEGKGYLRLHNLPVNEHVGEVLVVKLEFDSDPVSPGGQ